MHLKLFKFKLELYPLINSLYLTVIIWGISNSSSPQNKALFIINFMFILAINTIAWKKSTRSFQGTYNIKDFIKEEAPTNNIAGVELTRNDYLNSKEASIQSLKKEKRRVGYISTILFIFILYGTTLYVTQTWHDISLIKAIIITSLLLKIIHAQSFWGAYLFNLYLSLAFFSIYMPSSSSFYNPIVFLICALFFIQHKYLTTWFWANLISPTTKEIHYTQLKMALPSVMIFLVLFVCVDLALPSKENKQNSPLNKFVHKLLQKKSLAKKDFNNEEVHDLEQKIASQELPVKNSSRTKVNIKKLIQKIEVNQSLMKSIKDKVNNQEMRFSKNDIKNLNSALSQLKGREKEILNSLKHLKTDNSPSTTNLPSVDINQLKSELKRSHEKIKNIKALLSPGQGQIVPTHLHKTYKQLQENNKEKQKTLLKEQKTLQKEEEHSIQVRQKLNKEKEEYQEKIKKIQKKAITKQKTENQDFIEKIKKILSLLLIIFLFIFFKKSLRKKIIADKLDFVSDELKEEILTQLNSLPKKFIGQKEEIEYKYRFFHKTIERLLYPEGKAPPAGTLPKDPNNLLAEHLRIIAQTMGALFASAVYENKQQFSKKEIRIFRKSFISFCDYLKK